MSVIKIYRPILKTPLSNNSPCLAYFTPTKVPGLNKSSNILSIKKPSFQPRTKSAEILFKREKKRRFFFYQNSPNLLPNYIRYQSVKRKLFFEENDETATTKTRHDLNFVLPAARHIPTIRITSPDSTTNREKAKINPHYLHNNLAPNECITPNTQNLILEIQKKRIHHILGRGRYGIVIKIKYKAKDVAAKIMTNDFKIMQSILKNESNGIGLNHKNIINVNMVAISNKFRMGFALMNCYENAQNLQFLLDHKDFNANIFKILDYSLDICAALQYLHSKFILHLDVKPKNILVLPNNVCKLCDFGASVKLAGNTRMNALNTQFRGTTRYCAPEILKGENATTASDVYSLAITMWQILHRSAPYGYGIREESLIYQIVKNNLRPSIRPTLNMAPTLKHFNKICVTCWSSDFRLRYPVETIKRHLEYIKKSIL